jgi:hypothetical protein
MDYYNEAWFSYEIEHPVLGVGLGEVEGDMYCSISGESG